MTRRRARWFAAALLAPFALYLLLANVFLSSGLLTALTNHRPEKFLMSYDCAWTVWPGKVHVSNFRLSFQAYRVAFELEIDHATAHVYLFDLLKRQFHAHDVEARGVAWRQLQKGAPDTLLAPRTLAFPVIAGRPPIFEGPPPPRGDPQRHRLWSVRLDRVDAQVDELWVLEYRWRGSGTARGSFEVRPMVSFWVEPARLELEPGTLSVGAEKISRDFAGTAEVVIAPTPILADRRIRMLRTLDVEGDFGMTLDSLKFAKVYGLDASGDGKLTLHADIDDGRIGPEMTAVLELPRVHARWVANGAGFDGALDARLWEEQQPRVRVFADGAIWVPLPNAQLQSADVPETRADLALTTADFVERPRLEWFDVKLSSLVAHDTGPLRTAMKGKVPFLLPAVLGRGPLTAKGLQARGSPKHVRVRIGDARMGETVVRGQLELAPGSKPSGALQAHLATMPIGIALNQGKPTFRFLSKKGWLEEQLAGEAKAAERGEAPRTGTAK